MNHRWSGPCLISIATVSLVVGTSAAAHAQSRGGCAEPERPSVGVAVGKSLPYVFLAPEVAPNRFANTVEDGGLYFSGRSDVSLVGRLRVRFEGSVARWHPEGSDGSIGVRQAGVAIGLRGGPRQPCWYALVGPGIHSLTFEDATIRSIGTWLVAGIEGRAGPGVVQVETQLHAIHIGNKRPFSGSDGLALMLSAGWSYRF